MIEKASERDRHFQRRQKAAKAGLHLPTEDDLLRGMAFFRTDMVEDMREYASRLSRRIKRQRNKQYALLALTLDEMVIDPTNDGVLSVQNMLECVGGIGDPLIYECSLRCCIYRGLYGDPQSAASVAGELALLARRELPRADGFDFVCRALAWSAYARNVENWLRDGVIANDESNRRRNNIDDYVVSFCRALEKWKLETGAASHSATEHIETPPSDITPEPQEPAPSGVVVISSVGNDATSEGKRLAREFQHLQGRALPLPATPDLVVLRARLVDEFPHAVAVVDSLLGGLVGRSHVRLRPTILVGSPGGGKTRFVRRLLEELAVPFELVSCGGLSDSAIGGTARRWSTGEPSLPLMLVRRHECAGPAIVLDEVEKIGTSRHNGNVHDVLVGLLERETSSRWHDPYLEWGCDLSHLSWVMTANSLEPIAAVLRDRCRILSFPNPQREHLQVLVPRILAAFLAEIGRDPRWARPLDEFEMQAVGDAWGGGSIRKLERILELVIEAREREMRLH